MLLFGAREVSGHELGLRIGLCKPCIHILFTADKTFIRQRAVLRRPREKNRFALGGFRRHRPAAIHQKYHSRAYQTQEHAQAPKRSIHDHRSYFREFSELIPHFSGRPHQLPFDDLHCDASLSLPVLKQLLMRMLCFAGAMLCPAGWGDAVRSCGR